MVPLLKTLGLVVHVVHNSFKRGMDATGWQVSSFLSSLYYLFKDASARREDFVTISGSTLMPNLSPIDGLRMYQFAKEQWCFGTMQLIMLKLQKMEG